MRALTNSSRQAFFNLGCGFVLTLIAACNNTSGAGTESALGGSVNVFQAVPADASNFMIVAQSRSSGGASERWVLVINKSKPNSKCWVENGSSPTVLTDEWNEGRKNGTCEVSFDSGSRSFWLGGIDHATRVALSATVKDNDTVLSGLVDNKRFEVGRAHGVSDKEVKIELDPGWTYAYKYYQGKKQGGFYIVNSKSLEELLGTPAKPNTTNSSASAPSSTQSNPPASTAANQNPAGHDVGTNTAAAPSTVAAAAASVSNSSSKIYTCALQVTAEQMGQQYDGQMADYVFYKVPVPNSKAAKIDETIAVGTHVLSSSNSDGSDGLAFSAPESGAAWNIWKGKTKAGTDLKVSIDVLTLKFKVNHGARQTYSGTCAENPF